jgi:hypothetical protein
MEQETLASMLTAKPTSGLNHQGESTTATLRGGLPGREAE